MKLSRDGIGVGIFVLIAFGHLLTCESAEPGYWKRVKIEKRPSKVRSEQWWKIVPGNLGPGGIDVTYFSSNGKDNLDGGQYTGSFVWSDGDIGHHLRPGDTLSVNTRLYIHGRKKAEAGVGFSGWVKFARLSGGGKTLCHLEVAYDKRDPSKMKASESINGEIPGREGYGDVMELVFKTTDSDVAYIYEWQKGQMTKTGDAEKKGYEDADEMAAGMDQSDSGGRASSSDVVSDAVGVWQFNSDMDIEKAARGRSLRKVGEGIKAADGIGSNDGAVSIDKASHLVMKISKKNGVGEYLNTYTLMWDVMFPEESFWSVDMSSADESEERQ